MRGRLGGVRKRKNVAIVMDLNNRFDDLEVCHALEQRRWTTSISDRRERSEGNGEPAGQPPGGEAAPARGRARELAGIGRCHFAETNGEVLEVLMQNVWKGPVIGAVTGAGVGMVRDGLSRAGGRAEMVGRTAREAAPDVLEKVRHAATRAADAAWRVDVPEKKRVTRRRFATHKVRDLELSELADRTKEAADRRAREGTAR